MIRKVASTSVLAGLLMAGASLHAQKTATQQRFGSISGTSVSARYDIKAGIITYTGSVEIKTDQGDTLSANKVVLTLDKARRDVDSMEATGSVKVSVKQVLPARPGTPASFRVVSAQANRVFLQNKSKHAILTGSVSGRSEDDTAITTFRASSVDIDLETGIIDAQGSDTERTQMNVQVKPSKGTAK
jgi:lipopolysaccharide export system protein LptA